MQDEDISRVRRMEKEMRFVINPDMFSVIVLVPFGVAGAVPDGERVSRLSFLSGHAVEKETSDAFCGEVSCQLTACLAARA
jgi:hypothetical protein